MPTYLESLRRGLLESFQDSSDVYLIGEDIVDPYGGAFKVSKGLSTLYPDRVINTPICEAGFTGLATGMAIRGCRPIVEIMFGDFITLCTDQIVNHMTKFSMMYPGVSVPMVIRTPMGAGRGYGATHSQSIEKMYMGVPGLNIFAPSLFHDPGKILKQCILTSMVPTLFIENKQLYALPLIDDNDEFLLAQTIDGVNAPVIVVDNSTVGEKDVVLIAYGGVSKLVIEVMREFFLEEINIRAIFPSQISPLVDIKVILKNCDVTNHILILEEGTSGFNWGSEVACQLYDGLQTQKKYSIKRLSTASNIIPCAADLEDEILITKSKIQNAILEVIGGH